MGEFLADLLPWVTHGAVFLVGVVAGVFVDMIFVYREPPHLRGD